MSSVLPLQWSTTSSPSSPSEASSSQKGPCAVYVGADLQQSHQAEQVINCLIGKNLSAQNRDPSSATHFFLFITDSFLKTKDQVLPLVRRMVDPHFKQRLFPVIMEPTLSIYKPGDERPWVEYWAEILNNTNPQSSEYGEVRSIKENIAALIKAIRDTNLPKLDALLNDDLALVTKSIEKREHLLQQKRFFFLPSYQINSAIGLEAPLAQLSSLFEIKSTVVLSGEKGTGKTTLAIEYAKGSTIYPTGIFWFNTEHLETAFETLAAQLGTSKEDAKRELFRTEKALLIFDNVKDSSFIPSFPLCHTLIIGQHLPQPDITMTDLTDEDAVRLIGLDDPQTSLLAAILENCPAKIAAAKAYIKSSKISVENYIHFYLNNQEELLAKQRGNKPAATLPPVRRSSLASILAPSPNIIAEYQNQSVKDLSQELKSQEIQIFISYNWGSKDKVEQIDSAFKEMGIELLRDTREARPFASLPEFMKKVVRHADYTFSIVTDSYLKSFNCIFEVINLLKDPCWRSRIFPIVLAANSFDEQVYVTHWQQEAAKLAQVGTASEVAIAEEGARKIGPFLQFVKGLQLESLTDQLSTNFQKTLAAMLARQEKLEKKGAYRQGIFQLPMGQNKNFTGRVKEMGLLEDSLKRGQHSVITTTGLGGVGKSQLALEYAYRHQQNYEMIYWIRSDDMSSLKADYRLLGQEMGIDEKFLQEDRVISTVRGAVEKRKDWLLVFDNAEELTTLAEAIPQMGGHVLITSRNPNWSHTIGIEAFNDEEAVRYLRKFIHNGFGGADDRALSHLAKDLGYHPLALSQAGAYIKRQNTYIAHYRAEYKKHLSEQEKDYPGSVATVWLMSIEKIAEEDPIALQLLYICCFLAPDNIPETLLNDWLKKKTKRDTGLEFQNALKVLESYSMICQKVVKDGGEHKKLISINRLIQALTQDKCPKEGVVSMLELGVDLINDRFDGHITTRVERDAAEELIEHAKAISSHAKKQGLYCKSLACLFNKIGTFLHNYGDLGDLKKAKEMYENALASGFANTDNENYLDVASCYNNLGNVNNKLGRLKEAMQRYEKALLIIAKYGDESYTGLTGIYNNLGDVFYRLGQIKGAIKMYKKALEIYINTPGIKNLQDLATCLTNLGRVLGDKGNLKGAKEMYEKALATYIATLGTEYHQDVATCYAELGNVCKKQGDLEEAKKMYAKALLIHFTVLGTENHTSVADCHYNMGLVLKSQGDLTGSNELHKKARAIYSAALGGTEYESCVAEIYNNIGLVLESQGDLRGAKEMQKKALTIRLTEEGHKGCFDLYKNYKILGDICYSLNQLKEAGEYYRNMQCEGNGLFWRVKHDEIIEQRIVEIKQAEQRIVGIKQAKQANTNGGTCRIS